MRLHGFHSEFTSVLDLREEGAEASEGFMGDRSKSVPGLNVPVSSTSSSLQTLMHNTSLYFKILPYSASIGERCSCVVFFMILNVCCACRMTRRMKTLITW